jgi:outer membrane protein OmpA-like peptidoglycan-associated protein
VVLALLVVGITALITRTFRPTTQSPASIASADTPAPVTSTSTAVPAIANADSPPIVAANVAAKPASTPMPALAPASAVVKHSRRLSSPKAVGAANGSCREIALVHFVANSSELAPDEVTKLRESFTRAGELTGKLEIFAYCDDIGAADWNLVLSRQRANEVAKAVASIQPDLRLETRGFGSNDPMVPNVTWKARAENRRAEVRLCAPSGK